jgi:arylsulfatase A-like enzyme
MSSGRPNIIVITTDQQRADTLSCFGSKVVYTPNIDRLASEGVCFDRAYCTSPVCTPARTSLFTGRYPSRHGVWSIGINVPDAERLLSNQLSAAGYRTHYIGKAHFQAYLASAGESLETIKERHPEYPEFAGPYYGFDRVELANGHAVHGLNGHYGEWVRSQVSPEDFSEFLQATCLSEHKFGGEAYDWSLPLRLHNSVWTADRTVDFLEHAGGEPFFLAVGFQDPHHPHCVPIEFQDRVSPDAVPLPDFVEGELEDKPPHFLEARCGLLEKSAVRGKFPIAGQSLGGRDYRKASEAEIRLGRAYYYNLVKLIDQQVGRILDCLDRRGLSENTIVLFTSDHGELLGDHGLWLKGPFHYEQLIRVPLLMRWPNGLGTNGRRLRHLCSHVDIVPTLLAAASLPSSTDVDGRNMLPLLRDEPSDVRDAVRVECVDDPAGLRLKTIVTEDWKLTLYHGKDYGELYNLTQDPHERVNLWDNPAHSQDRARLLARLLDDLEPLEKRFERISYA